MIPSNNTKEQEVPAELEAMARHLFQTFVCLVNAGFDPQRAERFVIAMLQAGGQQGGLNAAS